MIRTFRADADRDIFERWLQGALQTYPDKNVRDNVRVEVDGFDAVNKGELPPIESLAPGGYDVVMLSGSSEVFCFVFAKQSYSPSGHTVHELDPPFIPKTIEYIRDIATRPDLQHLKIVGICFGHQIVSMAMGGTSERGQNGWEMGVYGCTVTPEGRDMFPNFGDHRPNPDKLVSLLNAECVGFC